MTLDAQMETPHVGEDDGAQNEAKVHREVPGQYSAALPVVVTKLTNHQGPLTKVWSMDAKGDLQCETQALVAALEPLVSRAVTSHCWTKQEGKLSHIKRPLTSERLVQHVSGGPAYGVAQIAPGGSTVRVACLDFDSHKGETPWADMQDAAERVLDAATPHGLRGVPFRSSGGAGIHLYFLWDDPQDAHSVRQALRGVLTACGLQDGQGGLSNGEVEVFPKQDSVPSDGCGNMFILPLSGLSVPLDSFELSDMPKAWAAEMDWPVSAPAPVIERELRAPFVGAATSPSLTPEQIDRALEFVSPDADYTRWLNVGMALHHESGGSDEGFERWDTWSAKSSRYASRELNASKWASFGERDGALTGGSLIHWANEAGAGIVLNPPSEDDFEVVAQGAELQEPSFDRTKQGAILNTLPNVLTALRHPHWCGMHLGHDMFTDSLKYAAYVHGQPKTGLSDWKTFGDNHYTHLREYLMRRGFKPVGRELIRDCALKIGDEYQFDSAQQWLASLPAHDGTPRCETFLARYCAAEDTPYTRAASRYLWTALAGRVNVPGCQADMALVFVDPRQGTRKTSAVKAIAPDESQFVEIDLTERDGDLSRKLRGKLVGELGELKGLASREAESIKAWISRRREAWIPKYREFANDFPRRLVFIGTTNQEEFLVDATGNRRWLPVRTGRIDEAAIVRDRDQLWAEAREMHARGGIDWQEAETLAREVHAQHMVSDPWTDLVREWLDTSDFEGVKPTDKGFVTMGEALSCAVNLSKKESTKAASMRMADVLKGLGFEKRQKWHEGRNVTVWFRT